MSRISAFKFLCLVLNPEIRKSGATALHTHLSSPQFSWEELVVVASEQRVSAMMASAIETHELSLLLPPDLVDYFEGMEELNRQRNKKICEQSVKVAAALNAIKVTPVFLKGSGSLLAKLYDTPAHRVMIDIDVLVPQEMLFDCVETLKSTGYFEHEQCIVADPRSNHYPSLFHADGEAEVEVHSEVLAFPNSDILPASEVLESSNRMCLGRTKFSVPNATHGLIHTIAHCHVTDQNYLHGFFVIRQMLECLMLNRGAKSLIDWSEIEQRFASSGKSLAYASQIVSLNDLFDAGLPMPKRSRLAAEILHKRALMQIQFPRAATMISKLLRPLSLLNRSMSDRVLRKRLFRNIFKPEWMERHWRAFRR